MIKRQLSQVYFTDDQKIMAVEYYVIIFGFIKILFTKAEYISVNHRLDNFDIMARKIMNT